MLCVFFASLVMIPAAMLFVVMDLVTEERKMKEKHTISMENSFTF